MFETIITRPIFNLLVGIYGTLPGHDFGIAIIIFTAIVKLLLWPQGKKQFESSRKIRKLQPEIKKIKQENKKDKQAQQLAIADLYKRNNIKPMAAIGNMVFQIPILFGLYGAVRKLSGEDNVAEVGRLGYGFIKDMPFVQDVLSGSQIINQTFLGFIDLSRTAWSSDGIYIPLILIATLAAAFQYLQTKQMLATSDKKTKSLREVLRSEAAGKEVAQSDINAATTQSMTKFMPAVTFFFGINFPGSVALYWMFSSAISYLLQSRLRAKMKESEPQVTVKYKSKQGSKSKGGSSKKTTTKKAASKQIKSKSKASKKSNPKAPKKTKKKG